MFLESQANLNQNVWIPGSLSTHVKIRKHILNYVYLILLSVNQTWQRIILELNGGVMREITDIRGPRHV